MQRRAWTLSLVLSVAGTFACSSEGDDGGGEETGGSGGSATGGTSGSATGGSATGGSATGGSATGGSSTGGSSGAATGGSTTGGSGGAGALGGGSPGGSGGSGGAGFTKRGICGLKSDATVTATAYSGSEEFYMVSDENRQEGILDEYICLIRFDVTRVGEAPPDCVDLGGVPCLWTHKVEISDPEVVTNVDGACEANELVWNAAWIAAQEGKQSSYGYVDMYEGHDSVVMSAAGTAGAEMWDVFGRASWNMTTGAFSFDNRYGECRY
jgi:hypothetical protein